MYEAKPSTLFRQYAIPQMVGLLFNSVYVIVDGVFIGHRLGREALAAAAVSVPLLECFVALAMAIATGAGVLVSSHFGRGENDRARVYFTLAVAITLVLSVLIAVPGNIFMTPLAVTLGATPAILELSLTYMFYIVTFCSFILFSFLLSTLARNDNRPKLAMVSLVIGALANVFLDWLFMYPLNMGLRGAALATAIGPVLSVLILLPHFLLRRGELYLVRVRLHFAELSRIFTLGLPTFVIEFSIGFLALVYNIAIVQYGFAEIGLAAYLLMGYLILIILTFFLGMAQGLQPLFSYFHGSGEREKSEALLGYAFRIYAVLGTLAYVLILLGVRGFYRLFTPDDTELLDFMQVRSYWYFWGFVFGGLNILLISYWQAIASATRSLWAAVLRSMLLPVVLMLFLPVIAGNEGIWTVHSLSEFIAFAVVIYFRKHYRN